MRPQYGSDKIIYIPITPVETRNFASLHVLHSHQNPDTEPYWMRPQYFSDKLMVGYAPTSRNAPTYKATGALRHAHSPPYQDLDIINRDVLDAPVAQRVGLRIIPKTGISELGCAII